MAKAAALSFISAVRPLVIITGAVYGLTKAFEYFNNRGKDVRDAPKSWCRSSTT